MRKIITIDEAIQISKELHLAQKKILLTGGCFDILHSGHINFLKETKKKADIIMVLLESDENIKRIKGSKRPINTQKNRSIVLSALSSVDYIIPLEGMTNDNFYDKLIVQIKPAYIAITVGDKNIEQREKQAIKINAELVQIKKFDGLSSSNYINKI